MKHLVEKLINEDSKKRFRGEIFVDVWADTQEEADQQIKEIAADIPNAFTGNTERM